MEIKDNIRRKIKKLRDELSPEAVNIKSECIFRKIENLSQFKDAQTIMLYWSVNNEVSTHRFIENWNKTKKIVLPAIVGNQIEAREFTGIENFQYRSAFKIAEPKDKPIDPYIIDLIIVPGLVFDQQKNRMGYGKGFYDRFLAPLSTLKIGICFNFQLVDNIPINEHDIPMDIVISD